MSIQSWEEFRERSIWEYELKIHPADLKLGHYVRQLSMPWEETHFPLQGIMVETFETKKWLQEHCDWVVIDMDRSATPWRPAAYARHAAADGDEHGANGSIHLLRRARIEQDTIEAAIETYQQLDHQAETLLAGMAEGSELDIAQADGLIGGISGELSQNLAALVWLTRIKQKDRYTAQHCINVAILAMGLSASLGWSKQDTEMAGLAGLLHDLGKMQLDLSILNKEGRLTPEEFEHVKRHTILGHEMLRKETPVPEAVAMAVLCHHERPDGTGYPQGLKGEQIPKLARMISIIDAYDAITSNRVYDPARSHHEALGILWKNRDSQFDKQLVEALTQFLGWVTPGTLVRLSDERLAIVMESPSTRGFMPLVRLIEASNDGHRPGIELDLAGQRKAGVTTPVRIAEVLPDGYDGVDLRQLTAHLSF
jgi:putative nucleotidyltransferase with HDIG domain